MGRRNRIQKMVAAVVAAILCVSFSTTLAFGDFGPSSRVLGVGRLQSTTPSVAVSTEQRLSIDSLDTNSDAPATVEALAAPIEREVAAPVYTSGSYTSPTPDANGWITTLATNYGTPGDDFLNKPTATGELTTETSMGVAHKYLPLGTVIEIYCPQSGLSCVAVVNDRGPYGGYNGTLPDTFDFQMGVTAALGSNYGWYTVQYRIIG